MYYCEKCRFKNNWPEGLSQCTGKCDFCQVFCILHVHLDTLIELQDFFNEIYGALEDHECDELCGRTLLEVYSNDIDEHKIFIFSFSGKCFNLSEDVISIAHSSEEDVIRDVLSLIRDQTIEGITWPC